MLIQLYNFGLFKSNCILEAIIHYSFFEIQIEFFRPQLSFETDFNILAVL